MAFGYSSYGCRFDKSIKQYFISGYCNYNGVNTFIGVYNNGLSGGRLISINKSNNAYSNTVECGEYGIRFEFSDPSISASSIYYVIIYPAMYGDVTIS